MATKIVGIEGMNVDELNLELERGGKFVIFEYCISIIVMTFRRSTNVYFIKEGQGTTGKSIGFTLISLILGWWGIPWGPIYTVGSLITNLGGGKDVTNEVIDSLSEA